MTWKECVKILTYDNLICKHTIIIKNINEEVNEIY